MSRTPDLSWETDYRHDRRAHRHRCLACGRIVNEGEGVVMAKVADRTTRTLHIECAGKRVMPESEWTYRRLIEEQAKEHLTKLGRFPVAA